MFLRTLQIYKSFWKPPSYYMENCRKTKTFRYNIWWFVENCIPLHAKSGGEIPEVENPSTGPLRQVTRFSCMIRPKSRSARKFVLPQGSLFDINFKNLKK